MLAASDLRRVPCWDSMPLEFEVGEESCAEDEGLASTESTSVSEMKESEKITSYYF